MAFKLLLFLFVIIKLVLSDLVDKCLFNALDLDLKGNECDDMTEWAWDTTLNPKSDYLTDIETKFKSNPEHTKFVCQCITKNDNTFENLKINDTKLYMDCYDPMIKSCKNWCEHETYELHPKAEDDEATKINKCNDFKTNYTQCNFKRNRLYSRVQNECHFTNDIIPSTKLPTESPTMTPTLSPTIANSITSTEAVTNDTNANDNDGNDLLWTPDPSHTPTSTPTTSPTQTPTASPSIAPTIASSKSTLSPTILMKNTSDSNAVISVNSSTTTSTTSFNSSTSTTANTTFGTREPETTPETETTPDIMPTAIINDTGSDNENIIIPETTDESAYIPPQNPGGNLMMVVIVIIGFCIFVTWFANKAKKSDEFSNSHERVSMKDEDNTTFNYNDDDDIESMNMKMRGQYKQTPNKTSLNGTKKPKKRKVKKKSGGKFTEVGTDDEDSGGDLNISSEEFGFSDDDDNNNTHTGANNIMPNNNNNNNIDSSNNKSHIKSHKTPKSNKSGKKNKIKKKKDKRQEIFTIVDGEDGNDSDWNFSESDDASNTDIHVNAHGNKIRGKMPLPYSSKKIKNKSNNIELSNKIKPMKLKSNNNDNIKPKKNNNISIDISRNWNIDSISPTSDDDNNNDTNNNDNNDDNTNNNETNNDNNNETDNKVDDSNVNVKTKKLTAETEYQREQARQLQYNIETQVPKSVLKHKRQVSITLNTWKSDDVQEWLLNIGDEQEFKKYIKIFNDNNIDGKKLNGMNKNDLENIGIQPNDIQKLYNEIQKSNKIFINPPLKPIINPKSGLTTQIKKVSEANEPTNDDDNNDDNDDDDQKATTNNENNDTTNDTSNNDTTNNDTGNNDDETAEETGDNWEAPFLPYMYDAPTITLSAKTIVKVYTSRIVAPYKKRAFALYEIEVIEGKEEWLLSKRYSEFYRLYESMKKLGVKTKITFPKKGLFTKSTDKQVMEERKKKLTNYLNELLKDHEIARKSKELNDFLSPSRTFVVDE